MRMQFLPPTGDASSWKQIDGAQLTQRENFWYTFRKSTTIFVACEFLDLSLLHLYSRLAFLPLYVLYNKSVNLDFTILVKYLIHPTSITRSSQQMPTDWTQSQFSAN